MKNKIFHHPVVLLIAVWFGPMAIFNLIYTLAQSQASKLNLPYVLITNTIAIVGAVGLFLLKEWGRKVISLLLCIHIAHDLISILTLLIKALPSEELRSLGYPGIAPALFFMLAVLSISALVLWYLNKQKVKSIFIET